MKLYVRILVSTLLLGLLVLSFFFRNEGLMDAYTSYIFIPYQQIRSSVFNGIGISIGDIVYVLLALLLLVSLIRLLFFLIRWPKKKLKLGKLLRRSIISLLLLYLCYFYSWGANYARHPVWAPLQGDTSWNRAKLEALNDILVQELNELADDTLVYSFRKTNAILGAIYKRASDKMLPDLWVKPSLFGDWMFYLGIQGYYNPLTGEAHVAKSLPAFMWPFVIAHEMAHQTGVAAEGEANFIAYVICVKSGDPVLQRSAYLNLFLYANRELSRKDEELAAQKKFALHTSIQALLWELEEHRKKYKSSFSKFSLGIYNWMLQQQGQDKGLRSYADISRLVYLWEAAGEPEIKLR